MAKVGFVSLGCPKNLVDSEVMLGLLSRHGHSITASQQEADIIVVNTCGFVEKAKQESVDTILEMAEQKSVGNCRKLIVAGCLVERYRQQIQEQIPEVDAVVGTNEIPAILEKCSDLTTAATPDATRFQNGELYLYSDRDPRKLTTPSHTAYIKIAEGCNHPCTFCVIPQMRGRFRSRPAESVLKEARRLVAAGAREINLVGQDTTMYGWDHGNRQGLADLIRELALIDQLQWVRFLYAYPNHMWDELLDTIAATPKACKYVDLPLQHASKAILKRMKRGSNRKALTRLIERIRERVPGVALRTTMIVGFPGETEEDFQELLGFVSDAEFDRLGAFAYSDEMEAASYSLGDKVPESTATSRRDELMQLQATIVRRRNAAQIGKVMPVMLEGLSHQSDLFWEGRLSTQAPEIDGVVYLTDGVTDEMIPGQLRNVRIKEAHDYDLVGTVLS